MIEARLPRLLDADLNERKRLYPKSESAEINLEPLSTASLTLEDGSDVTVRNFIEVYNSRGSAGIFRVTAKQSGYGTHSDVISMEHGACVLGDAIIPGEGKTGGTLREALSFFLEHQTAKAHGKAMWTLGDVPDVTITPYEYQNDYVLHAILDVMDQARGYRLVFDQSAFPWTMHVRAAETKPSCEGRLGRNVTTARVTIDESELCTRVYCSRLTGGYMQLEDNPKWGVVCQSLEFADEIPIETVEETCRKFLLERQEPMISVEIDMIELAAETGEPLDEIDVGRMFRLALPDYGVTVDEKIITISYSSIADRPEVARVYLANKIRDASSLMAGLSSDVNKLKNTSTSYGNRISKSETNITNLKEENEGFKEVDNKMVKWFASAQIDLDATEEGANVGILATYQETFDLFEGVDTRVTEAELILHGDGTSANAGLVARVTETEDGIQEQNAALLDLRADTESATAALAVRVGDNEAAIVATADELGSEIALKADKVDLGKYATVTKLEAEIEDVKLSYADYVETAAVSTQSLDANYIETNSLSVDGHLGKWIESPNFVKSIALTAKDFTTFTDGEGNTRAIPNSWTITYSRDKINYFGYG